MRSNELTMTVAFGETDRAGIVFYPNYFAWFDKATASLFKSIDLPLKQLSLDTGIILPILDAQCTFEKSLTDDDVITIKSTITEINQKTIKIQHEVFKDGTRSSIGYEVRGWVSKEGDRIKATIIPDHIREILKAND